jgi:hypothetical protein
MSRKTDEFTANTAVVFILIWLFVLIEITVIWMLLGIAGVFDGKN